MAMMGGNFETFFDGCLKLELQSFKCNPIYTWVYMKGCSFT